MLIKFHGFLPMRGRIDFFLAGVDIKFTPNTWFESGFTGFLGLTITSPVWVGRLLLNGAFISGLFGDALRISEKKGIK